MNSRWWGKFKTYRELVEATPQLTGYTEVEIPKGMVVGSALEQHDSQSFDLLESNLSKEVSNKVLEYGGSTGACWIGFNKKYELDYHIIETAACCNHGKKLFPELSFYDHVPELAKVDIFYVRTALQYAQDWKGVLDQVIENNHPPKIILGLTHVSKEETYYTVQESYSKVMSYCVINSEELTSFLEGRGYKQTYKKSNDGIVPETDYVYETI